MIIQENDYTNRHFKSEVVEKDLVVVGAGLVGLSVALTAARQGFRVYPIDCEHRVSKNAS